MKSPLIPGTLIMLLSWMLAGTVSGQDPADPGASAACGGIPLELYRMPRQQLQTRWYTFENQQGVKGGGGKAKFGRKGSPATWIRSHRRTERGHGVTVDAQDRGLRPRVEALVVRSVVFFQ